MSELCWDERFEEFLTDLKHRYQQPKERIRSARRFKKWMETRAVPWKELDPAIYQNYLVELRSNEPPYKPSTLYFHFRSAFMVAEYYSQRGYILWVPDIRNFIKHPAKVTRRFPPEPEDVQRLLKVPNLRTPTGIRDRAILELFYGSGLRVGEMAKLDLRDLDFNDKAVRVREPKNRKERRVPLTRSSTQALRHYLVNGRPFMLTLKNKNTQSLWLAERGRELKRASIQTMIQRHSKETGLQISCHDLRHACATHLLRGGASIAAVAQILGHTRLESTSLYTHLRALDLAKMLQRCHPRESEHSP